MLKLTVAIPAYNVAEWLERTLDSVLACGSDEYEILVIDDGSTDATPEIARQYQKENPGVVRHIRKENGHYGSVVNRAIREARGLYLRLLDGDDYVRPDGLASLIDAIGTASISDVILCDYREVYIRKGCSRLVRTGLKPGVYDTATMEMIPDFGMHSAVFRTAILADNGIKLTEGVPFTDQEYILYPMPFVHTIECLDAEIYQYRLEVEGQSVSPESTIRQMPARRTLLKNICTWFDSVDFEGLEPSIRDFIVFHMMCHMAGIMVRASAQDTASAREDMALIDEYIAERPLLSQNDCRKDRIKGYALMRAADYRFLSIWRAVYNASRSAYKMLCGVSEERVYDPRLG